MSLNEKIAVDVQKSAFGKLVTLYELDATALGESTIYYFTAATSGGEAITWNTQDYSPIDMEVEGFEFIGRGKLPRPKIRISNVLHSFASAVEQYDDLLGAKLTRRRTLSKYLDGEPEADPSAEFPQDIYVVEQKTHQCRHFIEWELAAYMDFEGIYLPKRQILRDTCTHRYRVYDAGFDYTYATCPYTGSNYFKRDGTSTETASEDVCGKRLSDCELRYPLASDELPTRAFPSVSKLRVPR